MVALEERWKKEQVHVRELLAITEQLSPGKELTSPSAPDVAALRQELAVRRQSLAELQGRAARAPL